MELLKRLAAAIVLTCGLVGQASAANVLYFFDSFIGPNNWLPAFAQRGDVVTTASSRTDLVAKLALGPWDVVVVAENNNQLPAQYQTALLAYIAAGNRVVFNNWYNDATWDATFEAVVGTTNQSAVSVTNPTGVAFTLTNPGWGVFSQTLTTIGTAQSICFFQFGSCAVVGNSGRTIRLGLIVDTLPPAQAGPFLVSILSTVTSGGGPKTFAQRVADVRAAFANVKPNELSGVAQGFLTAQLFDTALLYLEKYPSLALGILDSVIVRTDGCALRGTVDTVIAQGGASSDWVITCAAQGPLYASLKALRDSLLVK